MATHPDAEQDAAGRQPPRPTEPPALPPCPGQDADREAGGDRQPRRTRSGEDDERDPATARPVRTARRSHGGSISPASAQAGISTKGGTATDPNGVPSAGSRSGGRPGAPTAIHSTRRASEVDQGGDRQKQDRHAGHEPDPGGRWRTATRRPAALPRTP